MKDTMTDGLKQLLKNLKKKKEKEEKKNHVWTPTGRAEIGNHVANMGTPLQ